MKFPPLIRPEFCKTLVEVVIFGEGLNEDGAPVEAVKDSFYCNYQSKVKTVLTSQKKTVQCNGVLLFNGDLALDLPTISGGYVKIFGIKRDIVQGIKALNPDGTVNYTEVDVI